MKTDMTSLWVIGFALSLSACASLPNGSAATISKNTVNLNQLPAQTLNIGECGLFVWTADAERRFILFAQSQKMTALFHDGIEQRVLSIASQDGKPAQKQFPVQNYNDGQILRLLKVEAIKKGTRYKAGTLLQKDVLGWESVTPVVAVSTCR